MFQGQTVNFSRLIQFIMRYDKKILIPAILGLFAFSVFIAPALTSIADTQASIESLRSAMENPAMVAMVGPVFGDSYSYGAMYAQFMLVWTAMILAIFSILFVVRHTRKDEEEGRLEILGALPVGRGANLFAVAAINLGANLLISLLVAFTLPLFGVDSIDLAGSLIFGFSLGVTGIFFGAVAMIFSQLAATSRGAIGYSMILLGLSYLMKASGDVQSEPLALASPLGLIERSQAYVGNKVWPLLILILAAFILMFIAWRLCVSRDLGGGMFPARRGKSHAPRLLSGEPGWAFRLLRATGITWIIVIFTFSAAYGFVFGDMALFYEGSDTLKQMLGITGSMDLSVIIGPIVGTLTVIMSILSLVPALLSVLKLNGEERRGRLEQIFSKSVSRAKTMAIFIILAAALVVVLQWMIAVGMWGAAQTAMETPFNFDLAFKTSMNYIPAMWVYVGLTAFLIGLLPRLANLVWILVVFEFMINYMGSLLNVPEILTKITPFGFTPKYPIEQIDFWPLCVLTVVAILLSVFGVFAYRRRDLRTF